MILHQYAEIKRVNVHKTHGQPPQCILTMPLLEGLDGEKKMSKSLGNYIGISEDARTIFGKLMSVSDQLMWRYIELLSLKPLAEIRRWRQDVDDGRNPMEIKVLFAQEIVERFHSKADAEWALGDFQLRHRQGEIPADLPQISLTVVGRVAVFQALKQAGVTASTSEAIRMIEQGGVKIDGEKILEKSFELVVGRAYVVQVGKRKFARLLLS